ncbi:hypothetical protein B0T40_16495 [Chromobacterium haemolyticum]|nr:hypothetical protein B0T40_16495 [Chromobacterium haemolyticum]
MGEGGSVIDPKAKPLLKDLKLKGRLELGESLSGSYVFEHNNGDSRDQSLYGWGVKGLATPSQTVKTAGQVPARKLEEKDIGQILEVAVQAKNGAGKTGNTVKLATNAKQEDGNDTEGGDDGKPINPQAKPTVVQLQISGKAEEGQSLSATYQYQSNNSGGQDRSRYAWGAKGKTAELVKGGETIGDSGQVPEYKLGDKDVGLVMEVSVRAQNSLGKVGGIATKFMEMEVAPEAPYVENVGYFSAAHGKTVGLSGAHNYCNSLGGKLPSLNDLKALYKKYPNNTLGRKYGWSTEGDAFHDGYHTSTLGGMHHYYVNLKNGGVDSAYDEKSGRVACVFMKPIVK